MAEETKLNIAYTVEAKVIRKDGTVEELGVIASGKVEDKKDG